MSSSKITSILRWGARGFLGLTLIAGGVLASGAFTQDASKASVQPFAQTAPKTASNRPEIAPIQSEAEPPLVPETVDYSIKGVLDIGGPLRYGDHVWDESGAPADGQVIITVDLKAQTLSVFRGGYEIGVSTVLYGHEDKKTPLGVFPITEKDADHVSNLYDAEMPYMLRLTNDGISIHGSEIAWGYATHGCIGVPVAFAKKLFGVAKLGDKVIVTDGEMLQVGGAVTAI